MDGGISERIFEIIYEEIRGEFYKRSPTKTDEVSAGIHGKHPEEILEESPDETTTGISDRVLGGFFESITGVFSIEMHGTILKGIHVRFFKEISGDIYRPISIVISNKRNLQ